MNTLDPRTLVVLLVVAALVVPATSMAATSSRADVARQAPRSEAPDMSAADANSGSAGVQVRPSSGSGATVSVSVSVDDANGHNDITSVRVTVFKADQATQHLDPVAAGKSSASGKRGVWSGAFSMAHHDEPGTYWVRSVSVDRDGDAVTTWSNFTYESLSAVSVSTDTISFTNESTSFSPGDSNLASPYNVTITNSGNSVIDLEYSATAMSNATTGDAIDVSNVLLSLNPDMSSPLNATLAPTTLSTFDLAPGENSSKSVYVGVQVPSGIRAGDYAGTLTLGAVADQ